MKDIMFFIGLACWIVWFANIIYYTVKNTVFFNTKVEKIIQFLAITLIVFSWYIV